MSVSNLILDGHKLSHHKDRVDALLSGQKISPVTIDCSMGTACNMNCKYCYGSVQTDTNMVLPEKVLISFLDDAKEIGVKAVSFVSDGESTCNPSWKRVVLHGKQIGLDIAMATNGILFDPDVSVLAALTYLRFNVSAGEAKRYAEIHGVRRKTFDIVCRNIRKSTALKRKFKLPVTIGLQMVTMPEFKDQIIPLAKLGEELGVDYTIFKHCSDDEQGNIGVNYKGYKDLIPILRQAEKMSTPEHLVKVKWSKILSEGKRHYKQCYGPPLIAQFSGSGLVAPCGMLFNDRFKDRFHIGYLQDKRFKEIWQSERYWEVMRYLASDKFDAREVCGSLCLQHKCNEALFDLVHKGKPIPEPVGEPPEHVNFL